MPDKIFIIRMKHYMNSDLKEINDFLQTHSLYEVKSITSVAQHLCKEGYGGDYEVIVVVGSKVK